MHCQQRLLVNHSLHWEQPFPVYSGIVQCQQSPRQVVDFLTGLHFAESLVNPAVGT